MAAIVSLMKNIVKEDFEKYCEAERLASYSLKFTVLTKIRNLTTRIVNNVTGITYFDEYMRIFDSCHRLIFLDKISCLNPYIVKHPNKRPTPRFFPGHHVTLLYSIRNTIDGDQFRMKGYFIVPWTFDVSVSFRCYFTLGSLFWFLLSLGPFVFSILIFHFQWAYNTQPLRRWQYRTIHQKDSMKKTHHFVCYFALFSGHLSLKIHWKLNLCIVCEYLRTIYSVLKCSCRWTTDWTGEFCCCSYFLLVCRRQLKIKRNRNPLGVIFIRFLLLPWWRVKMIRTSS